MSKTILRARKSRPPNGRHGGFAALHRRACAKRTVNHATGFGWLGATGHYLLNRFCGRRISLSFAS